MPCGGPFDHEKLKRLRNRRLAALDPTGAPIRARIALRRDRDVSRAKRGTRRFWLHLIFLAGVLNATAYALLVPPWQAPDEPGHMEYACLLAEHGRPPGRDDRSPDLEAEIIASLARNDFWPLVREPRPDPLPASFAADPFLARSGRQVGDETPLYYLLPALLCHLGLSLEARLRLMRLYGALLFGLVGVMAAWAYQDSAPDSAAARSGQSTRRAAFGALHAACSVLLPMPAFIGGSLNNDGLALLAATTLFAFTARVQRLGLNKRRGLGLLALLALALLSKKSNLFLAPWLAIVSWQAGWLRSAGRLRQGQIFLRPAGAALLLTLLALALPSQAPAAWQGRQQPIGRGRVEISQTRAGRPPNRWAAQVIDSATDDYGRLFQSIMGVQARRLQGQRLQASILVRSASGRPQPGRLTVRDATTFTQVSFVADSRWQPVTLSHTVAAATDRVKLSIAPGRGDSPAETGSLLVDDVVLRQPGEANLLRNSSFEEPARWGELLLETISPLRALAAPLERLWQRFGPRLQGPDSLAPAALRRYGLYLALTFAGFWGNFGWLQLPLPVWLYALLAVICLLAAAGVSKILLDSRSSSRNAALGGVKSGLIDSWLLATALIGLQTFAPMIGRFWQPQGRYLFPALWPLTGLLLLGLNRWLDFTRHPWRAWSILALVLALDAYCLLGLIVPAYPTRLF